MNDQRPVNLDLRTFRFPITAIISILHRLSGLLLCLLIPFLLWGLQTSLDSYGGFDAIHACFASMGMRMVLWLLLSALWYHLIAGIRHLLMDFGIGETKEGGRLGAWCVIVLTALAIIITGVWLW